MRDYPKKRIPTVRHPRSYAKRTVPGYMDGGVVAKWRRSDDVEDRRSDGPPTTIATVGGYLRDSASRTARSVKDVVDNPGNFFSGTPKKPFGKTADKLASDAGYNDIDEEK